MIQTRPLRGRRRAPLRWDERRAVCYAARTAVRAHGHVLAHFVRLGAESWRLDVRWPPEAMQSGLVARCVGCGAELVVIAQPHRWVVAAQSALWRARCPVPAVRLRRPGSAT